MFMSRLVNVLSRDFVVPVSHVGLIELPQTFMFLMVMRKREFPIIERPLRDHKTMVLKHDVCISIWKGGIL